VQGRRGGAAQDAGRLAMKRATSSSLSKDAASVPTFADVARLVADADTPPWLEAHFERWSPTLTLDRLVEKRQPTKTAMKKRLAQVRDAALLLRRALYDTPTREFLEIAPLGRIKNPYALVLGLQDLAERADRATASSALSTKSGKTIAGRTRAVMCDAFSPKLLCVALIAETWVYFHGGDPAPRSRKAAAAADAYWHASGGKATGWGKEPLNGWRYYFRKVQEPAVAAVRAECRRHLVEAEKRWE
jgi:hypothetical protein